MNPEKIDSDITSIFLSTDLLQALCLLAVLTVSFDIFLVLNLGFNFRATQVFLFLPIAAVLGDGLVNRRWIAPPGLAALLVWTAFILGFIPNSGYLARGAAYGFWLIFNVLTVVTVTRVFHTWPKCNNLMKFYLLSFDFVALFGLLQFLLPLAHIKPPLVEQWWVFPILARINGFSYEPSYFSSYLIMGWVLLAWLMKKRIYLLKRPLLIASFWIITLSLLLSGSRMGWLLMILWLLHYPLHLALRAMQGYLNVSALKGTVFLAGLALVGTIGVVSVIGPSKLLFLVNGLGIAGTAAHSSEERTSQLKDTLTVFANSPIYGCSLGGVSPALGELNGVVVRDVETSKLYEGMCIFAEVLAASGIVGVIPFFVYLFTVFRVPLKLARGTGDRTKKMVLQGMVLALLFELMILQMNQNVLRPYLWMHIAILSALCMSERKSCPAAA